MEQITILGAGGWGTALAILLSQSSHPVTLWARRREHATELIRTRVNERYLANFEIPREVRITSDPREALSGSRLIISAIPSRYVREILQQVRDLVPSGTCCVSAAKGIDVASLKRMSEVHREVLGPGIQIVVLSGPSFAVESVRGDPTAVVAASQDSSAAERIQRIFSSARFRVYTNSDVVGTEIGGAVKNVIAIASGVVTGLGFGSNTTAGLITRGLAEVCRLAVAMGGRAETLGGLAGLGDLVLTCTGSLSRNRSAGIQLAQGRTLQEVEQSSPMVAEGIPTTMATVRLARKFQVEMPITEQMYQVLYARKSPQAAIGALMERRLKEEFQ
ncbi:MAG TPA: NAD(P)H-dependent glycerol-3-phosphate dehydrogenase [Acidobacteriota bacterium]|jgi:glycerol-3-phosphate dehydrogenase (NAD(P)+)|nr:NAD(P)H-dependent glycerol-3-phosphate dehydrogenase [Acidobacteriota bacterium]